MADRDRASDRLAFIDVLRGVIALIVVLAHALPTSLPGIPSIDPLNRVGHAGILVFLMISGFFLPITCEQGGSLARFWIRRFFRLFPIYWLCIAVTFGIFLCGIPVISTPLSGPTPGDWILNLTMLQEFFGRPSVLFVFWTLKLELVIYAVFSLLVAFGLQRRTVGMVTLMLAVFAVSGVVRTLSGQTFGIGGIRFYYFSPLMGLAAYRYCHGESGRGPMLTLGLGQAGLLLASWIVSHTVGRAGTEDLYLLMTACVWGLGYGAFFLALANRHRRMPAALAWIGRISYSVYLFHILVLSLLAPLHLRAWAYFPLLFAITIGLSALTYRLVEAPGIVLGRALERRWLPHRPGRSAAELTGMRRAA